MIRRVVEYIIGCDAKRVLGRECPTDTFLALNTWTQEDCAQSARKEGWERVSKRYWLCPKCSASKPVTKTA